MTGPTVGEEAIMQTNGHATFWGTHIGAGRSNASIGWLRQLREWFAPHRARQRGASLNACHGTWNADREHWRQLGVESSLDDAARQGGPSTSIILYGAVI